MTCPVTVFTEEVHVTIADVEQECCEDAASPARVRYNGMYCHVASANFDAYPTGLPPCSSIIPPPLDPPILTDPLITPTDPVTSDPIVPDPPADEPPPVIPIDTTTDPTTDGTSGSDTTVPVDPPPDAPPVVVTTTTFRIGRVLSGTAGFGIDPLPDGLHTNVNGFPVDLAKARAGKFQVELRLFNDSAKTALGDPELDPTNALYDPLAVVKGFNLRKAKLQYTNAHNLMPDIRSYVSDGTIVALMLLDDLTAAAAILWGGKVPTGAELDALAKHVKSVTGWSTVVVGPRCPAYYLKSIQPVGGYLHIDIVHDTMISGGSPPPAFDPLTYFKRSLSDAKSMLMGSILGSNLLDGGCGPLYTGGWDIRPNLQTRYGMSPTEIDRVTAAFVTLGDHRALASAWWSLLGKGSTLEEKESYYYRSDIQAALMRHANAIRSFKQGPINYR